MRKLEEVAPPEALTIRRMTVDDFDAVLELQRASFTNPWSAELVRREMSHDWSTILLAEDEGPDGRPRLLGFLIYWLVHDELHVLNLATNPRYRRRGVGRRLMEVSLQTGRLHKCSLATLEVRRSNEPAIALYRAFGFRAVGVRPNYYVDEGEDAIVMVADL